MGRGTTTTRRETLPVVSEARPPASADIALVSTGVLMLVEVATSQRTRTLSYALLPSPVWLAKRETWVMHIDRAGTLGPCTVRFPSPLAPASRRQRPGGFTRLCRCSAPCGHRELYETLFGPSPDADLLARLEHAEARQVVKRSLSTVVYADPDREHCWLAVTKISDGLGDNLSYGLEIEDIALSDTISAPGTGGRCNFCAHFDCELHQYIATAGFQGDLTRTLQSEFWKMRSRDLRVAAEAGAYVYPSPRYPFADAARMQVKAVWEVQASGSAYFEIWIDGVRSDRFTLPVLGSDRGASEPCPRCQIRPCQHDTLVRGQELHLT